MEILIQMLTASGEKHGFDKPLTISHLLNILKFAQKVEYKKAEEEDRLLDEAYMEILADQCGDRD